jgi:hypothetical protein
MGDLGLLGYPAGIDGIPVKDPWHPSELSSRFRTPAETAIVDRGLLKMNEQREKGRNT